MNIDKLIRRKQNAKRVNDFKQLAEITKTLGDMYFESEQPTKALQEYTEQLNICENLQDKLNSAIAHRMIGEVHASLGDYERALIHQNLHLEGARDMKNMIEEQRAFATLGRTYFCLAESLTDHSQKRDEALANAKLAYVNSMELCSKLTGDEIKLQERTLMQARLLLNLGLTLEAQKETQQAIDLIEQATELCVSNNFQEDLHRTCISLAAIYERQGNYELVLNYMEKAATVQDISLKAEAKVSKAEFFMRTGRWIETRKILIALYKSSGLPKDIKHQVEKYLRIIVTLCRTENNLLVETDIRVKQKLYETLGDAAVAAQCFDKGVEYYRDMLNCAEETGDQVSIALISLAQTLKDAGRYKEALPYARRELELCIDPREKCRSTLFLADLLIAAKAPDSEIRECYTLASNSAKESDRVKLQRSVAEELVNYLENTNQFDEARDIRQRAGLISDATSSDTESEATSLESDKIGADICLEELSDFETEDVKRATKRRPRTGMSIVKRNAKGETQLHVACINGDIDSVEKLLSSGHSTNVRDHCGWSPLHEAANHGYVDIAELLLKHGANVNDPGGLSCKGITPLHDAACCGHFSIMHLLMQHGANVKLKTHDGDTVLDCLEDWKDRVEDLSPEDLTEYNMMYKKLSAVISVKKKRKRSDNAQISDEESTRSPDEESEKKISAGEDYKRTIANLRSFNKTNAVVASFKRNDAPLVNETQVLIDNWLDDDIGDITKKRSSTSNNRHTVSSKRKSDESTENITKKFRLNRTIQDDDYLSISDENSAEDNDEDNSGIEGLIQLPEEPKRIRRKRQTSLISKGSIIVSRSSSPIIYEPQSSSRTLVAPEQQQQDTQYVHLRISIKEDTFDLKVAVCKDEKEFLARITTTAESTFFRETACTVKLQLRPINGDVMTKERILKIAVEKNARLECEIVDLTIPSIVERYKTICHIRNSTPRENMLSCLKSCENTSIFRTKPDDITKELIAPLLKTLEYERKVTLLQLSGIALSTAGTSLYQCLSNLSSLQELYLKGCDIDFACLRQVISLPPQLRVLDLSYNPLGSESHDILRGLIAPLRYLRTLNLCYCKLEDFNLLLDNLNLTSCDISWNKLSRDAITYFLNKQLLDLNLSNVACPDKFVSSLITDTTLSSNLESLELSFCHVTDFDVKIILARLPKLLKLILRGNANVTVLSMNVLLSRQPTLSYIDISGCKNIASSPEEELIIQNPEVCTLLANIEPNLCDLWLKLWRGAGIVTKLPHNLAIFKPIRLFAENNLKA